MLNILNTAIQQCCANGDMVNEIQNVANCTGPTFPPGQGINTRHSANSSRGVEKSNQQPASHVFAIIVPVLTELRMLDLKVLELFCTFL